MIRKSRTLLGKRCAGQHPRLARVLWRRAWGVQRLSQKTSCWCAVPEEPAKYRESVVSNTDYELSILSYNNNIIISVVLGRCYLSARHFVLSSLIRRVCANQYFI